MALHGAGRREERDMDRYPQELLLDNVGSAVYLLRGRELRFLLRRTDLGHRRAPHLAYVLLR